MSLHAIPTPWQLPHLQVETPGQFELIGRVLLFLATARLLGGPSSIEAIHGAVSLNQPRATVAIVRTALVVLVNIGLVYDVPDRGYILR